jgi:predicted transcriptional regulator
MRTTLTLDDDLAARLKALARKRGESFRDVVNEAIRRGLEAKAPRPQVFRVQARDLGLRPGLQLDNVTELLEQIDGPAHR